jgi:hypothetical protein
MSSKLARASALTEKSKKLGWPESVVEVYEKLMWEISLLSNKISRCTRIFIQEALEVTTSGGSATEEFVLPHVKSSYHVLAQIKTKGASPVSVVTAKCEQGKVIVEFSGDPSDDHSVLLVII